MTTLTVSGNADFTFSILSNVTLIDFTNGQRTTATASFLGSQFNDVQISNNVTIDGSTGINRLSIVGNFIIGSNWTFTNWGANDLVTMNGTTGADTMYGSAAADRMLGGESDDYLIAMGSDSLFGGLGNDVLTSNQGVADGGDGRDVLNIANVFGGPMTVDLRDGGGGRDIGLGLAVTSLEIFNGTGSGQGDLLTFGNFNDWVFAQAGNDTLDGGGGNDTLYSGDDNDRVSGGAGRDIVGGGGGVDALWGGSGADKFSFWSVGETGTGASRDVIKDFEQGLDLIDLYRIDAISGGVNDAFVFIGQTAFEDFYGPQVRFFQAGGNTIIQVRPGDYFGEPVSEIKLIGLFTLTANDFIL